VRTRKPATRLTDSIVKRLTAPASGNEIAYDADIKGFGCRVTAAGTRAFVLNYRRKADGRERRITIGSFPDWRTASARDEAKRLKRYIDGGGDPVGDIKKGRAAPAVADLCKRFKDEYLPRKRASTQDTYRQQMRADIEPALGRAKVAAVTHDDVDALHRRITDHGTPIHANQVIALLSRLFTLAIRWGWRQDNPCKGIERNPEHKRQRYLTGAELVKLTAALAELQDVDAANAVRLLLLTGARRGEALSARWRDFDLDAGVWTKPGATTKQKTTHRVPLSAAACQLLTDMRAQADPEVEWLFPARRSHRAPHRRDVNDAWAALRKTADIPDVRLHDLRHTFASVLASSGLSLPIIGQLLGHTTAQTTHRYAHLFDDPLRAATERASAVITGASSADIVPLPDRRRG
jgi:integrase